MGSTLLYNKISQSLMSRLFLLCSSTPIFFNATALGAKYEYHPNTRLYMGGGYNPFKPTEGFFDCIEHDGEKAVDSNGAVSTLVRIEQVKTRQEFYQKIDFSASIAGSFMFILIASDSEDSFERYSQVPKVLSEYVKTMTAEKSAPTSFITKHISAFKDDMTIQQKRKFQQFNFPSVF